MCCTLHVHIQCTTHNNKNKRDHAKCTTCHVHKTTKVHARENTKFTCCLYVVLTLHVVWTLCCVQKHIDSRDRIVFRRDHKHVDCLTCTAFCCGHKRIDCRVGITFFLCVGAAQTCWMPCSNCIFLWSFALHLLCCGVTSNILIDVFTPCDHKHVDWLSHIVFCCGYDMLRIRRGRMYFCCCHNVYMSCTQGYKITNHNNNNNKFHNLISRKLN